MATANSTNPPILTEGKHSKKKRGKSEVFNTVTSDTTPAGDVKSTDANGDNSTDSPYLKELAKYVTAFLNAYKLSH